MELLNKYFFLNSSGLVFIFGENPIWISGLQHKLWLLRVMCEIKLLGFSMNNVYYTHVFPIYLLLFFF